MKPKLAITMGDVNGIGPEVLAKALASPAVRAQAEFLIVGSLQVYEEARRFAPGAPAAHAVKSLKGFGGQADAGTVPIFDGGHLPEPLRPGQVDASAGRCAVEWVRLAARAALAGSVDAMVTCPLNKEGMHLAGIRYAGHTELVADETGAKQFRLALFSPKLRIIHNSAHCSLRKAIDLVTQQRVAETLRIGHEALVRMKLPRRHIAVCGLNPHAGEAGAFGSEDIEIIRPAIEACRAAGIDCSGPYPADTVFGRMVLGDFDLVAAMYHDQGHGPMKLLAMDDGVNVTLGVPIVRTSVDHGTAYDIAWRGVAREQSLRAAINLAIELAQIDEYTAMSG